MQLSAVYLFAFALGFQLVAASWIARFARHAGAHGGHPHGGHHHGSHAHGHHRGGHARGHPRGAHRGAARAEAQASPARRFGEAAMHVGASLLNVAAWGAFLVIAGAIAIIGAQLRASTAATVFVAVPSGLVAAALVTLVPRWIDRKTIYLDAWQPEGTLATVLCRIASGRTGEIVYAREGARASLPAVSAMGTSLEPGTEVVVLEMRKGVARVAPASEILGEVEQC